MLRLMNEQDRARADAHDGAPFIPTTPGFGTYRCGNCRNFQTCEWSGQTPDTMPCGSNPRAPHRSFDPIDRPAVPDDLEVDELVVLEIVARQRSIEKRRQASQPAPIVKPGDAVQFILNNRLTRGTVVSIDHEAAIVRAAGRDSWVPAGQILPAGRAPGPDGAVMTVVGPAVTKTNGAPP